MAKGKSKRKQKDGPPGAEGGAGPSADYQGPGESWGGEHMNQAAAPILAMHPSGAHVAVDLWPFAPAVQRRGQQRDEGHRDQQRGASSRHRGRSSRATSRPASPATRPKSSGIFSTYRD